MFKNLVLQMHRELITSGGGSNSQTELENSESNQQESNQNPPNPPAPPTDPNAEYTRQLQDSIRRNEELAQRNADLMAQLDQRIAALTNPAPRNSAPSTQTDEEINAEYYAAPGAFVAKRIDQALERTVKPLNDFVQSFRSNEQVDNLISQVKQNPKLAAQWDSSVEDAVRRQLSSVPAANLNLGLAQQAAVNAIGLKVLGAIGTPAPSNPPAPSSQEPPVSIPPNVRPSNPPAPNSRPAKKAVELNENERRMARENGQSPEEFVFWRDIPADKVMTARWDKSKNEGTY